MNASESQPRTRRLRADAEENREKLLVAGKALLARHGDAFSLSSVVVEAGVGAGTLHRHFPNKGALLLAIYLADIRALARSVHGHLADLAPEEALSKWLQDLGAFGTGRPGASHAFRAATHAADPAVTDAYQEVLDALDFLLERCSGSVSGDVRAEDILLVLGALWDLPAQLTRDERIRSMVDLVVRGLRSGGG